MKRRWFVAICIITLITGLFCIADSQTVKEILQDIANDNTRLRKQQQEDNALKQLEKQDSLSQKK